MAPCERLCTVSPGPSLPKGWAWAPIVDTLERKACSAGLHSCLSAPLERALPRGAAVCFASPLLFFAEPPITKADASGRVATGWLSERGAYRVRCVSAPSRGEGGCCGRRGARHRPVLVGQVSKLYTPTHLSSYCTPVQGTYVREDRCGCGHVACCLAVPRSSRPLPALCCS